MQNNKREIFAEEEQSLKAVRSNSVIRPPTDSSSFVPHSFSSGKLSSNNSNRNVRSQSCTNSDVIRISSSVDHQRQHHHPHHQLHQTCNRTSFSSTTPNATRSSNREHFVVDFSTAPLLRTGGGGAVSESTSAVVVDHQLSNNDINVSSTSSASSTSSSSSSAAVSHETDSNLRRRAINEPPPCDSVLALRGVTLKDSVQGILDKRQMHVDDINLFLESSNTPLPWETDTSFLGGHRLLAKWKQDSSPFSKGPLFISATSSLNSSNSIRQQPRKDSLAKSERKLSFAGMSKRKPDKLSLSVDAAGAIGTSERCSDSAVSDVVSSSNDLPPSRKERSRSQGRLSQIFPNPFKPDDRLEMLEKLTHFQENGLLTAAGLLQDVNLLLCQNAFQIEESWQNLVTNFENIPRKQREQQDVIWELVTTELNYIKKTCCIVELQACVGALQSDGFLTDVDCDFVFGNILDICRANLRFWLQCLHPLLQYTRQTGEPLDPTKLEAGFQNLDRLFHPYIPYCLQHVEMLCYIRRKQKESELFREFALWVQSRRVFGRLHLTDLLAKPMQRLTKYPLLLKAILKNTSDTTSRDSLNKMIETSEEFASKVNIELCHKQHYDALCAIMQCIEAYEPIETANDELDKLIKEHSYVDLTAPMPGCRRNVMRQLILRGDLKLREAYSKIDVVCFLFTDMFMICKSAAKKGDKVRVKIIRPPFHLDRVVVRQLRETTGFSFLYLNEFNLPSAASTFLTTTNDEAFKWLEHFHMAKEEYSRVRSCDDYSTIMRNTSRLNLDSSLSRNHSSSSNLPTTEDSSAHNVISGKSSTHLAPDKGDQANTPCRRISIGAVDRNENMKTVDVQHRKSSSVDNTFSAYGKRESNNRLKFIEHNSATIRDSHSSSCLPEIGSNDTDCSADRVEPTARRSEDDSMLGRLRANSAELIKRLSPKIKRKSWEGSAHDVDKDRGVMHDATCNKSQVSEHIEPSVELNSSQQPIIVDKSLAVQEQLTNNNLEPTAVVTNNNNNNNNEKNNKEVATSKEKCSPSSRRLERRYHTADGIEQLKPRKAPPSGILKRFSWSTPAQHLKSKQMLEVSWRKASSSTMSSDSFCSSSGVSSSGSQINVNSRNSDNEPNGVNHLPSTKLLRPTCPSTIVEIQPTINVDPIEQDGGQRFVRRHVSTITIGGDSSSAHSPTPTTPATLNQFPCYDEVEEDAATIDEFDFFRTVNCRSPNIPIIETNEPPPNASRSNKMPAKEDLLRFILEGNLEASDV